jgi:hypothetical protein
MATLSITMPAYIAASVPLPPSPAFTSQAEATATVQKADMHIQKANDMLQLAVERLRQAACCLAAAEHCQRQGHDQLKSLYNAPAEGASEDAKALPYYLGESLTEDSEYLISLLKVQVVELLKNSDLNDALTEVQGHAQRSAQLVQVAKSGWQHTDEPLELGA